MIITLEWLERHCAGPDGGVLELTHSEMHKLLSDPTAPVERARQVRGGARPVQPVGAAVGGEMYDCAEHNCSCGWTYVYAPDETMAVA